MLIHKADATTTGAQFGFNIGAAPTAAYFAQFGTVTASVTAAAVASGVVTARDTAGAAETTSSITDVVTMIYGYIQPSADGTFALRATSEVTVAAGLTVEVGSWLHVQEIALT
jgi:hypothetical protein